MDLIAACMSPNEGNLVFISVLLTADSVRFNKIRSVEGSSIIKNIVKVLRH